MTAGKDGGCPVGAGGLWTDVGCHAFPLTPVSERLRRYIYDSVERRGQAIPVDAGGLWTDVGCHAFPLTPVSERLRCWRL